MQSGDSSTSLPRQGGWRQLSEFKKLTPTIISTSTMGLKILVPLGYRRFSIGSTKIEALFKGVGSRDPQPKN